MVLFSSVFASALIGLNSETFARTFGQEKTISESINWLACGGGGGGGAGAKKRAAKKALMKQLQQQMQNEDPGDEDI